MTTHQGADFGGAWQYKVDDGTYEERLELSVEGTRVRGVIEAFEHGYFSGRTKAVGSIRVEGVVRDGRLDVRFIDPSSGGSVPGEIFRRGAYLVLRNETRTVGYARPGTSLVQSADGSREAQALAGAISGKIFQTSSQVSGRGAFVGGRTRFAFCANGDMSYDDSDVAATPGSSPGQGVDMGRSTSRRGQWSVVLYAGAPAIMARWQGTGTSYSLTAYFEIHPSADGQSIEVNGRRLTLTGRC